MKNSDDFTTGDFLILRRDLTQRDDMQFREIAIGEFRSDFERLGLKAPRKTNGREVGFRFDANGFTVIVWSTFDAKNWEFRKKGTDAGWVLIRKGDKVKYFSGRIIRRDNFLKNLCAYAWISRLRVMNIPNCEICNYRMDIVKGKGFGSRYLSCPNWQNHPEQKKFRLSWDYAINKEKMPKTWNFIFKRREARAKQRKKMIALGKETDTKAKNSKRWTVEKPQNQE